MKKITVFTKDIFLFQKIKLEVGGNAEVTLSEEHREYVWLTYKQARDLLYWDSNKTALYELDCRLRGVDARG